MGKLSFTVEPFRPSLTNPHAQTVWANVLRPETGVTFTRQRVETTDGDFVDLDWPQVDNIILPPSAPLVLVLHGLEGNARRGYTCELYRQLAQRGLRSVGLNFRSCSGEMNRTAQMYNAGTTADVAQVVALVSPTAVVGFSLGANMMLKYLGEADGRGSQQMQAAVAISPPMEMAVGSIALHTPLGRLYGRRLLHSLHAKVREKHHLLVDKVDVDSVLATRTLYDFDELATAPLYGYKSAADYYQQCSSARFMAAIQCPTLLLRALDDPMISAADIPHDLIKANPYLHPIFPHAGGHVGFMEGIPGRAPTFWAERQAARFLAAVCAPPSA